MSDGEERFRTLKACPACDGTSLREYQKGTYTGRLTQDQIKITDRQYGQTWNLSVCGGCGHIFANPCPTPDYLASLYGRVEDPLYEEEALGRAKNFLRILRRLEQILPQKGTLFDVGAATGILLDLARRRGWEPAGIEPSSWAVKVAAEKYRLGLVEGHLETAPLPEGRYEAVTMVDFIEHTPVPFEALRKASAILKPAGVLVLVTPDIRSRTARLAGRRWWHLRPAHVAFFSRRSLDALFRRAGFRVISERRYAWSFSAHYLFSRKRPFRSVLKIGFLASLLKKIPVKLALGDSFEVYAVKDGPG
ncbi:MAG: class I SAM-dependent methyltransferase [Candidatus Aminicenantes bacterium]|nr:class I SAM-dependent methyltransferase [Candidatus Aminicenantes bacterium]